MSTDAAMTTAPSAPGISRTRALFRRATRMESRVYASIGRAIARRPAVPRGARAFTYHRPVLTILVIFIVLSAVEIPIIDLIVHRWPVVRVILLIVGVWGLTWMIGFLCAFFMYPHTVGPRGIQVREGLETDVALSWDDIVSVARSRRVDEPKTPRVTDAGGTSTLSVRMQNETNVEIELERSVGVTLPGRPPRGGAHEVARVRLWVDDLGGFMAAVREHMP